MTLNYVCGYSSENHLRLQIFIYNIASKMTTVYTEVTRFLLFMPVSLRRNASFSWKLRDLLTLAKFEDKKVKKKLKFAF